MLQSGAPTARAAVPSGASSPAYLHISRAGLRALRALTGGQAVGLGVKAVLPHLEFSIRAALSRVIDRVLGDGLEKAVHCGAVEVSCSEQVWTAQPPRLSRTIQYRPHASRKAD